MSSKSSRRSDFAPAKNIIGKGLKLGQSYASCVGSKGEKEVVYYSRNCAGGQVSKFFFITWLAFCAFIKQQFVKYLVKGYRDFCDFFFA